MLKALVTGAKGMLGQDLCPVLEDVGFFVYETDVENLDITNFEMCKNVIKEIKPDFIFHLAGYTNVDKAEEDIETALLVNEKGTENVAKICSENDITLIYISTDYVFDGAKEEKLLPNDETKPINNYGLSKLKGEEAVKRHCKKYYIARTSWLYGLHGKNFVDTMIDLASKNDELNVVDDQTGCPTWTMDLANGIIKLIANEAPYGIYHICGSGQTTWYNFAKKIFELENIDVKINPVTSDVYKRLAKRPKFSVMENEKICRNWEVALKDYLSLRGV